MKLNSMHERFPRAGWRRGLLLGLAGMLLAGSVSAGAVSAASRGIDFDLVRSNGVERANCLPSARGHVSVHSLGPVEVMQVEVDGLPPKTEFDLFVIQVPEAPFGVAWYQGDVETDGHGHASQRFIGRFNVETFAVAVGSAPAPPTDGADAPSNPAFKPVHTYHLGLWFNSPADAQKAGCANTVTPFNGEHNAGSQLLNTKQFPNEAGPLRQLAP